MSKMQTQSKNNLTYYIQTAAYNIAVVLSTGSVIQTYMLECGINESKVSFCVSALQIIQTVAMLLISKATESIKNIRLAIAVSFSAYLPFFASLLFLCLKTDFTPNTKYIIIFAVSIVLNLFLGIYNIVSYKLPHIIMDISNYGRVLGQSGVVAGITCMGFSSLLTFCLGKFSYFSVMLFFFAAGIVIGLIALASSFMYKPIASHEEESSKVKINFFKYKPFYQLIIPNFMRGFSLGIFNLITVIGYSCGLLDSASAGIIATVTQLSMLISCQSYSFLVRKFKNGLIILFASVAFCVITPLMTVSGSKIWFYIFYFLAYFFVNYVAYSVPVLVSTYIDYKCLSQYTAWRMALYTLGIAVGGALVPFLMKHLGATGSLIVCAVTLLPCGIGYYLFEKASLKNKKTAE